MLDYFTTTIQKQRQRKYQKVAKDAGVRALESRTLSNGAIQNVIVPSRMEAALANAIEQDMDTFSSQDALDYERAYYKVYNPFKSVSTLNLTTTQDELK